MRTHLTGAGSGLFVPVRTGRKQPETMSGIVYRDQIIRYGDYRKRAYDGITVCFDSFLDSNMAYVRIRGGSFAGNGWEDCNLFGMELSDVVSEMDRFDRCSMGGIRLKKVELDQDRFQNCVCAGGFWEQALLRKCSFTGCNFRGVHFEQTVVERSRFRNCVFDAGSMAGVSMSQVVFQNCVFVGHMPVLPKGCRLKRCVYEEQ